MQHKIITVSPASDSSGDFHSIQEAINSIAADNRTPVTIRLAPGIYHEKITLDKPHVTLLGTGSSNADTVISFDDYARFIMPDGKKRGTFRSYTLFIDAHDVTLRNLTVENASGDSHTHGQAIALYADGDRLFVDACRLLGHQDTLFTGPLPPKEYEPDGFIGPKQFAPRVNGRQYYQNCYICGDVDFIFGSATAYFEGCTLESLRRSPDVPKSLQCSSAGHETSARTGNVLDKAHSFAVPDTKEEIAAASTPEGYVTAASTPEGQEYGYVFSACRFVSADCPPGSVYLGRPWRDYARTVLLHCELGPHIHPAGFHDWNKTQAHETVLFAEYGSVPAAGGTCRHGICRPFPHRADFVCELDAAQAAHFSREQVLCGADGWRPFEG